MDEVLQMAPGHFFDGHLFYGHFFCRFIIMTQKTCRFYFQNLKRLQNSFIKLAPDGQSGSVGIRRSDLGELGHSHDHDAHQRHHQHPPMAATSTTIESTLSTPSKNFNMPSEFFKYGPNPASFCVFSSFSQYNDKNSTIDFKYKKHRWCAWD